MCVTVPYEPPGKVIESFDTRLAQKQARAQFLGAMNEDRDTRDQGGGPTNTERGTETGSSVADDVWARAAEQALRDMARAQRQTAGPENSTA
jgi:hypothetical protein